MKRLEECEKAQLAFSLSSPSWVSDFEACMHIEVANGWLYDPIYVLRDSCKLGSKDVFLKRRGGEEYERRIKQER